MGADQDWRVRVEFAPGTPSETVVALGAGVLLGGRYVLTCAHVIGDAGASPQDGAQSRIQVAGKRAGRSWKSAERGQSPLVVKAQ